MMRKLKCSGFGIILIIAATLSFTSSSAAAVWVPLNGIQAQAEAPSMDLLKSDYSSVQLDITLPGFSYETVQTKGGTFSRLLIGDEGYTTAIGSPELPVMRRLIEIPYGARAELIIKNTTMRQDQLSAFGLQNRIIPVQPPVEKIPGAAEAAPFILDEAAYNRDAYQISEFARLGEESYLRGHRFVMLEVYLMNYNPATGDLRIVSDIEIEVKLSGSDLVMTQQKLAHYNDPYIQALANRLFLNHGSYDFPDLIPPPLGLLIVTNTHYAGLPVMQDFVTWKTQKGYHVTVATTAQTGATKEQIKAYIQNAYDNWAIPPNFVLLIGDTDVVPHWTGSTADNPGTDLYYATLEGSDYFNDVGIGRLSPSNDANFAGMINKTLNYEQCGWTVGDNWIKRAVFMASNDNYTVSEGTHNYVIANYLDPDGYQSTKLYCHTYGATTQQVTDNINAGRSLAIYSGHGSVTSWADGPVFTQSNVNALTNAVYPLVTSHACLTGQFQSGECFGETWIRTTNGTCVFWGSSVTSYWDEDDILEKGMFEGFFDEQSPQQDQNLTWVSGMTDYGKYYLWQHYGGGGMSQRYWEMYNILGDPTVDIWTASPHTLTVTYPSAIMIGQNSITINVSNFTDWAMVNIYSSAENMQFTGYVSGGSVTFNLGAGFTQPGTLHIWVTGHDCRPFHGQATIVPPTGPFVIFNDCDVNDASVGNNNGQWDFAETVDLSVELKNVGVQVAPSVNATITESDPLITVIDNQAAYGNINAGDSVRIANGFRVQSGVVPDQHAVTFNLTATSGTNTWNSNFNLIVNAPVIEFDRLTIQDPAPGNNNGTLDPGETASFLVNMMNTGHFTASNTSIALTANNPLVTITGSPANYGNIIPGASVQRTYTVNASNSIPVGTVVRFTTNITANGGYTAADQFDIIVGDSLNNPSGPDAYGYRAYDPYDAPELPVYNWMEISADSSGPGTVIAFTADDQAFQFDLPFSFRYYGQNFSRFSVGANGWVAMGDVTTDDYSNSGIPNSDGPANMIAAYWEDLSPQRTNSGKVWRWYDATNHRLVVEYNHIEQYTPTGAFETFQVILLDPAYYPTQTGDGRIKVQYKQMSGYVQTEGTIGIENGAQTDGIQYLFDASYHIYAHHIADHFAILYTTATGAPSLDINISAVNPPIVIPANGGSFQYNINIHNTGAAPATFQVWNKVRDQANFYVQVFGPVTRTLPGGANPTRVLTQTIAGSISSGTLYFISYIGNYPSTVVDSSFFTITKTATADGGPFIAESYGSGDFFDEFTLKTAVIPEEYSLGQNYPNPFNPTTAISYELRAASFVNLSVYDISGRKVVELVNGMREAGAHSVTFDASNLASGIYLYKLEAGDFSAVSKMVLMK